MAKRDVVNYYLSVQKQYFEMLDDVKDYEEALAQGKFTQEQNEQARALVEAVKENYDRLSYIILLLQEPNREKKKAGFRNQNAKVYDYLSMSSDSYIKSENEDILKRLKKLISEAKNNG